jgi:hypothetical protein
MSLKINSEQQRIEGSGVVATGSWRNATYLRQGTTITVTSVGHGFIRKEDLQVDVTSGGATSGIYEATVVDADTFTLTDSASGTISAGSTLSYRVRRSLEINAEEKLSISIGTGASTDSAITVTKDIVGDIRVGINNTEPEFELDVEGQIRTTRSIISDTARIINLDIGTIVNPALNLRAPNLLNYTDTDVTSPDFGTTFYPTADTPPLTDQSRRIATTDFVYKVATNDTGGRVYVSSTIGSDDNDGRSAARPVATIKKAAQIAYGLQEAVPTDGDEYVSIIVSGGEYLEDNPITLPRNCSLIGDNLRRVVARPLNSDRHMLKASNETYVNGVTFRDALQNQNDPYSATLHTWKYAFVFDDKQRLYYEPELGQVPAQPGDKYKGVNVQLLTFRENTGGANDIQVGYAVLGATSRTVGTVQSVTYTGPVATPYATGTITVLVTSGVDDTFSDVEKIYYDVTENDIDEVQGSPTESNSADLSDVESLRPELETISNQVYQHTVDSESETLLVAAATAINATTDLWTVNGHGLFTGAAVTYDNDGNTSIPGVINGTTYYARVLTTNTFELYDTFDNANLPASSTTKQGRLDVTGSGTGTHYLSFSKVSVGGNSIFIERHGLKTGEQVYYRASKFGGIGNLVDNAQYAVYAKNVNEIQLADSAADATNKNASGVDAPVLRSITSTGKGFQRFDRSSKLLNVLTVDTSLNTVQTYNGPIINLGTNEFHDYEVGQEVNLYGFQSSVIDFGGSAVYSYNQTGSDTIECTITGVDTGLVGTIWGNLTSLGEAGLKFTFSTGNATSKTYHIDQFTAVAGFPSLPGNTALGMGRGSYDSPSGTVRFSLKAPNTQTTSGTFSISDNLEDLNGRKYVTHRIERADGFSLAFVVRGNYSVFNTALNPTGDQTVISASNYVLASLSNSPYGFDAVNQTDRFRDGAEAIRANQEFIAEEAYAFVKSHHTSSSTRGTQIPIGGTSYTSISGNTRSGSYSISGTTLTVTVPLGHTVYALSAYTFTWSGALTDGGYTVSDTPDYRTFTITLANSNNDGETGTVDFTTPLPHVTPGSKPQDDRYADAAALILANRVMIADLAVERMVAEESFTIPTGNQSCKDDTVDFLNALAYNITFGGNDQVYDAAKYYVDGAHVVGEEDESVIVFNYARDYAIQVMRNLPILRHPYSTLPQIYDTSITLDTLVGDRYGDSANLINSNLAFIANEAVERYLIANPSFTIPTGNQNCIDDVTDVLRALTYNLAHGGNDAIYDAASYYTGTTHVDGEETETQAIFNEARDIAKQVLANTTVTVQGSHGLTQVKDLTITVDSGGCADVKSSVDTLIAIVTTAVANDNMSHATRTAATNPTCANVASAITTLTSIVTQAIGSTGSPGNLNGITRTYAEGDQQCLDDVLKVLRAFQHDLRYTGNSKTAEAANKYIASGVVQFIANEIDFSRQVYNKAKELCILAIRNDLDTGEFSQIAPVANGAVTVDPSSPECANVVSALTTNWSILDTVLSTSTAYTAITNPDPIITELGASLYSFPLLGVFLDLPIIEASPYIQNSSLISFRGGSGCEIDGAKVATPNVPRPGLKTNAQGQTVANSDPQGKSMVASAFTIISFGGTAYNVINDGYTQLVSVFAIFCQDGIVCQSGGYASVTNSASNFGTYSLRATGFRAEPYVFDIAQVVSVTNEVDGNGVETGRQEIQITAPGLTNIPIEDYLIRFDEFTNTNPAQEVIILETEINSGSPGSQINATITTNQSLNLTRNSDSSVFSYQAGNIAGGGSSPLVGATIKLHRPSIVNSSSHTWEYAGSGNTYAALPQNGGIGRGTSFEAREESFGQVYTSGTNEFGDFKVGNFVTIFNRTGAISFVGTVSISELSSIKITGGDITITGFSADDNLGGAFASDALLPTQSAVRDYISNNLGPYLNQPYSTNAVPSALVQLTSTGKINIDQIPALRPFNITSVASTQERLAIEDANAGDIAIETSSTTFNVAPSDVNTSTEEITISSHGLTTGDSLTYTQGTANIGGLATGNQYYAIVINTNTIKLAVSDANASAGTAIDLTSQGTGTQQFTTQGIAVSYILENDLDSQYLAFTPNQNASFTLTNIVVGSSTTARGVITAYNDGAVYQYNISNAGSGYTTQTETLTISQPDDTVNGVQAAATANILNGSVVSVTITNIGKGYYSAPTVSINPPGSGTTASIGGLVEARLSVDIANSIKFDAGDFILDGANATEGSGTYAQGGGTTIVVTENGHGLSTSDLVYLDFTSGTAPDGFYTVTVNNVNEYQVTTTAASTTSGNVARKRILDLSRVVNTSASDAANWTQLTSTNIDASNIVAGTIDPERLASRGVANSFTFLRGDSSYEYALQSIRPASDDAMVVTGSLTDNTYIDSVTITSGGTGYTPQSGSQVYQNLALEGGVDGNSNPITAADDGCARASFTITNGVITAIQMTDGGTGYAADFTPTIPAELGAPSQAANLTAVKGTINRAFGNIGIDIRKANNVTTNATVYGNYGLVRFRKDVANQALANQTEGGFIVDANGGVRLDQGTGSGLTAEFIEGAQGRLSASDLTNASTLTQGTIGQALLSGSYTIDIIGSATNTDTLNTETASTTSNPTPSGGATGLQSHLRNNTATGLADGGTTHGVLTFRRTQGTPVASTQLGFTDNNNLWIRGNSGSASTFSNWYQIWSQNNDGRGDPNSNPQVAGKSIHASGATAGPNALYLDGQGGLWYQSGHNMGDNRGHGAIGQQFLPEVLGRDKFVLENFYVAGSGSKFALYIPNFHVTVNSGGNLVAGGTYTVYSDSQAIQNIGTMVVDSGSGAIVEGTGSDGAIYSVVSGTITFTASQTGDDIRLVGPSASGSSRWTVTSVEELSANSAQIFAVADNANGPFIEFGKTGVSSTPTLDFRSSGSAGDYDVRLIVSGGSGTNGQGTLRINANSLTVNGNTVWHEGNDGAASTLDARYLQGAEPATTATLNTIVKRDGSAGITGAVITGTQGTFTNNTTSLSLGDTNGFTIGKSDTNTVAIKGKANSNRGYIRFGNDTRFLGWDETSFYYDTIHFRSGHIGVGTNNPSTALHIFKDRSASGDWMTLEVMDTYTRKIRFREADSDSYGAFTGYDAQANEWFVEGNNNGTLSRDLKVGRGGGVTLSSGGTAKLTVGTNIGVTAQIQSSVTTGTAPFTVASTTVVTNLNADLLDGYTALGLPYLGGSTNTDINSTDGNRRFYFANNSTTYIDTPTNISFQAANNTKATMNSNGRWTLDGAATSQNTYRIEIIGSSGLNINATEALASGQKSTVLRAGGDKQWIDTYGVFKRNRQTVGENITVAATDSCMSAGPITINNGVTITIADGGSWSIV